MHEMWVQSLGQEDPLEKGMATHSSILAWRIPRTEEPGGLQSIGSQRVRHDWSNLACMNAVCICSFPSIMLIFHEKLLEGVLHRKDPHSYLCFAFLGDRFYFYFIDLWWPSLNSSSPLPVQSHQWDKALGPRKGSEPEPKSLAQTFSALGPLSIPSVFSPILWDSWVLKGAGELGWAPTGPESWSTLHLACLLLHLVFSLEGTGNKENVGWWSYSWCCMDFKGAWGWAGKPVQSGERRWLELEYPRNSQEPTGLPRCGVHIEGKCPD